MGRSAKNNFSFKRSSRVGGALKQHIAEVMLAEIDYPQKATINVTRVEVSDDLTNAKIFYRSYLYAEKSPTPEDIAPLQEALDGIVPELRHRVAKRVNLRKLPKFHFIYDAGLDHLMRIEQLLQQDTL